MPTFRITNLSSGLTLGDYQGDDGDEAGVAMLRDAGYPDATADDISEDLQIVELQPTIIIDIDTDTLNDGADLRALSTAIAAEFPGANVTIKSTGRGTEVSGFKDNDAARAALRVVIERANF